MIQILVKEMCSAYFQRWKSNAIYKFKNRKYQKLKMEY